MSLLPRSLLTISSMALLSVSLLAVLVGCEAEHQEQAREVAKQAADKTGEGVDRAREAAGDAARKAGEGVQVGVDKARDGIADARERYEVDDKLDGAKQKFGTAMDETAEGFAELAEAGKDQSAKLAERLDGAGLEVGPDSVRCDEAEGDKPRRCHIDPTLAAKLRERPMLLATDAVLKPKTGATGKGLELGRLSEGGLCDGLGLRQGDVLLVLNGVPLDSFDAIRDLDEALATKHLAVLTYEREGKRETVEIQQQVPDAKPE